MKITRTPALIICNVFEVFAILATRMIVGDIRRGNEISEMEKYLITTTSESQGCQNANYSDCYSNLAQRLIHECAISIYSAGGWIFPYLSSHSSWPKCLTVLNQYCIVQYSPYVCKNIMVHASEAHSTLAIAFFLLETPVRT